MKENYFKEPLPYLAAHAFCTHYAVERRDLLDVDVIHSNSSLFSVRHDNESYYTSRSCMSTNRRRF